MYIISGKDFERNFEKYLIEKFPPSKGWYLNPQLLLRSGEKIDFVLMKGNPTRLIQATYKPKKLILYECKDVQKLRLGDIDQLLDYRKRIKKHTINQMNMIVAERTQISRGVFHYLKDNGVNIFRFKVELFSNRLERVTKPNIQ